MSGLSLRLALNSISCIDPRNGLKISSTAFWCAKNLRSGIRRAFGTTLSIPKRYVIRWYRWLQSRVSVPYPEGLRRGVVKKNWPILRRNHSSYRWQIELALKRGDAVSVQHRVTALMASFFDVWFAIEKQAHPGEKRLLTHLPEPWAVLVRAVLDAQPGTLLAKIDSMLDRLDERLVEEGLLDAVGQIEMQPRR